MEAVTERTSRSQEFSVASEFNRYVSRTFPHTIEALCRKLRHFA
jgi:hypothetical protein